MRYGSAAHQPVEFVVDFPGDTEKVVGDWVAVLQASRGLGGSVPHQ